MIPITRPFFDEREIILLKKCLDSRWVTQGPMTARFEEMFREVHPTKFAYAVSSCTAALHISMLALGIGPGDEVIVPAYTWVTSASCVEYVGGNVRFVDVEKDTFNLDPTKLEAAVTYRTKAIVAVHLFGCAADMDPIMSIAKKYNLYVIEDCACAIGTKYKGTPVGTIGNIGCFSFHPRKIITTGEGGICITNDEELAVLIQQYRNHGASLWHNYTDYGKPYYMGNYDVVGYNLRMSDIQAAVGVAQLEKLPKLLSDRKKSAEYYLRQLDGSEYFYLPSVSSKLGHTYQSFVITLKSGSKVQRNALMDAMNVVGIQSRPGTIAIQRTIYNRNKYSIQPDDFPVSSYCEDCSVTLPIYPFMDLEVQDEVIEFINNTIKDVVCE